jgi:hypothetical protein
VGYLGQHSKAAFALYQCHDGLFVCCANDGIAVPVAHLLAILNAAWSFADRAAVRDLPTPVTSAQVAFAPGLLAAQVLV